MGSAIDPTSAEQFALLSATSCVVGVTEHVASPETVTVKLPLVHEPPTPVQVQLQLAAPSPLDTLRSVDFSFAGHGGFCVAAKLTSVQPCGTS